MDRCALFVDAGYMLADGALAVHGTRNRESVSWDYPGVVQFLGSMARDRTGVPLLRCYWYEATVDGRRSPEHDALADLAGVKLRLARMHPGQREGVQGEIHRDLTTLARNRAASDALVVSADENLAQVIADVQDLGMRVTVIHISAGGSWTISRTLRQECDGILEIGDAHLRPYVELVMGAEPPRPEDRQVTGAYLGRTAGNGHGHVSELGHPPALPAGALPAPPALYTAPMIAEYQRGAQPPNGQPPRPAEHVPGPAPAPPGPQAYPQPGSVPHSGGQRPGQPVPGQPVPGQPGVPPRQVGVNGQHGSRSPGGQPGNVPPGMQHSQPIARGPAAAQAGGAAAPPAHPGQQPAPAGAGQMPSAYQAAPVGDPAFGGPHSPGQPGSAAPPRGQAAAGQPRPGQSQPGYPAQGHSQQGHPQQGMTQPGLPPQAMPHPGQHHPGYPHPAAPHAAPAQGADMAGRAGAPPGPPGVHMPPSQPMRQAPPGGFRDEDGVAGQAPAGGYQGYAGQPGVPGSPPMGPPGPRASSVQSPPRPYPGTASGRFAGHDEQPPDQQMPGPAMHQGARPHPGAAYVPPQGPYSGPQPAAHEPIAQPMALSLADAVQAAHGEGFNFGQAVARDAPVLWLEAVLARKPRMPSDLEARLLQDSSLPIDSLLHDEVRHALRRGFWDALERTRH